MTVTAYPSDETYPSDTNYPGIVPPPNTGWLLDEDRALKNKLSGLYVQDADHAPPGNPVDVKFRLPENELSDGFFPLITIHHTAIERDAEREHRGKVALQYVPVGGTAVWPDPGNTADSPYVVDYPIPYNLDYEIRVYTRLVQHRMSLLAQLADVTLLPDRFGYLDEPQTNTVRRLDMMGKELEETRDQDNKRLFRTVYAIRISSELPPSIGTAAAKVAANGINLELLYKSPYYSGT